MTTLDSNNKAIIDLDAQASPAILAGILDIPVSMVHQGRQDGKLPPKTSASYRESIQHYILYYKRKISTRSTTMGEAKLAQDIRNGIAKEQQQWLEIKQTKLELLDVNEIKDLFEPVFHIIRSSLVNVARKHPSTTSDIDNMLSALNDLGQKVALKASKDADEFVKSMLEKEFKLEEAEDEMEEAFLLNEGELHE